jgi:hypothetical protein
MTVIRRVCLVAWVFAIGAGPACNSSSRTSSTDPAVSRVNLTLEPSTRDLMVGETVTITARNQDTYGRDSQINWTSTSGKLSTEQNGRIARVRFDHPGAYSVSAVLMIDGQETRREAVEIRVKPLS